MAFLILASYDAARSPIESLFIEQHGARWLPAAWIGVAIFAVICTGIYARYLGRFPLSVLFGRVTLISAGLLVGLIGLSRLEVPGSVYALYLWKDIYIVILIEMFWTVANAAYPIKSARWLYGLFCAVGSAGAFCGAKGAGWIAGHWGTEATLGMALAVLLLCWAARSLLSSSAQAPTRGAASSASEGFAVLLQSRYLMLMLALIAVVQVVITLVDYEYHQVLEHAYPNKDDRTVAGAQVYQWISVGSLIMQVLTAVILRVAGVAGTLLMIPLVIGGTLAAFIGSPRFLTVAIAKVTGKLMDYSIFRAAKEILYIPLSYPEKTQGKAFIDMMTYRVAKGGVSLLLLVLPASAAGGLVSWSALLLVGAWFGITVGITRLWRARAA